MRTNSSSLQAILGGVLRSASYGVATAAAFIFFVCALLILASIGDVEGGTFFNTLAPVLPICLVLALSLGVVSYIQDGMKAQVPLPIALPVLSAMPLVVAGDQWRSMPDFIAIATLGTAYACFQWIWARMNGFQAPQARSLSHDTGHSQQSEDSASSAIMFKAEQTGKTFADVKGMSELKARLESAAKEVVASQGVKGTKPRNGILLSGDPGNGKTLIAEALAGQMGLRMITATFGEVASRWTNQTTEQVKKVFVDAHAQAPCVLFLDEVDSLLRDRSKAANSDSESARTTNVLLTELVNARKAKIVVVAATNHLDSLDPAAIREGRFDFKIEVTPPDEPARAALIVGMTAQFRGVQIEQSAVDQAAKRWEGFSVARIRAVAEEAARSALKAARRTPLTYSDLQAALRTIQGRSGKLPEGTLSLSDLSLPASLRSQLVGISTRMREIEAIEAMGGKVPSGLLFSGPPGTGKTATVRALAKDSGWAFLSASGNDLLADQSRIDKMAKEAKELRPCIVFIDEADDILADRRYSSVANATNKLLTAMDGASGKTSDVLWVAATNHPEQMDAAALRGGRFTEKVMFALPDAEAIGDFVRRWTGRSKAGFSSAVLQQASSQLAGISIANIAAVLQRAVDIAVERAMANGGRSAAVTEADIDMAREQVLAHA